MLGKHNVLKRVWPKLWFNLNVYMQFPVCLLTLYFRLLRGSLMSMATKVAGAQRNYILPPCTVQSNQHLFLASIQFSSEYLLVWRAFDHAGPCSVWYLPYILCKSHLFMHYWSLYKFCRLMLVLGARFCKPRGFNIEPVFIWCDLQTHVM